MAGLRVFVSHAGPDRAWAEWVAWHLDQAGYEVELDLWWSVGESFVARMRQALDTADVVVALWSAAYFEHERFTSPEWESVIAVRDGTGPRLVPLRVEPVMPPTLLRALLWA
ncbi:MAG TPA: toll/interleukin-1 receptor domain-containing protein, partial [Micromonosporaceae bacterium]|nr:toll/interleukin-1 receptor domain-containing protein [Micromonosporaceae bacterium]